MSLPRLLAPAFIVWAFAAFVAPAEAQTSTATLSADIGTLAKLTLSTATVSFPDADPDLVPQIPSLGGPIAITAKSRATGASQVMLTVVASDDLRSGLQVIAASAITWTATGPGFQPGTLSQTTPVTLAQWTGSGVRSGTQQFMFRNLWTYATGTFTASLTYTLSAP
jgi:hypothetical protein